MFTRSNNRNNLGKIGEPSRIRTRCADRTCRKVHRECLDLSPETKFFFSNITMKTNLDKHRKDAANAQMKDFCGQKDIGLVDNCNLEEHHLGMKVTFE